MFPPPTSVSHPIFIPICVRLSRFIPLSPVISRAVTLAPVTCYLPLLSLVTSPITLFSHKRLLPTFFPSSLLLLLLSLHYYCTLLSPSIPHFYLDQVLPFVKMATPSRPQFFCTRPDGTLTPLVALDELPTSVTIRGISRTLNAGETQGMTS